MKTKEPKTYEQYIVKRLNELEEKEDINKREIEYLRNTRESAERRANFLIKEIEYLVSLFKFEEFKRDDGSIAHIYKLESIWDVHDEEKFNKLKDIIDRYTETGLPF